MVTASVFKMKLLLLGVVLVSLLLTPDALFAANSCRGVFAEGNTFESETSIVKYAVETAVVDTKAAALAKVQPDYEIQVQQLLKIGNNEASLPTHFSYWGQSIWAEAIQKKSKRNWFRGMFLPANGKILLDIAKKGLEVKYSQFDQLYFSREAETAIEYISSSTIRQPRGKMLRVIFQIGSGSGIKREDEFGHGVINQDIPATYIEKIYVFNKDGPDDFPFIVFTPNEFLKQFNHH